MSLDEMLLNASGNGDIITVRKLLRKNPNVHARDISGYTALSKASKGGHFAVVKALIEAESDKDTYNAVLIHPLHLAAAGGHAEVVKLLISSGGKFDVKDKDGFLPYDLAQPQSETWDTINEARLGNIIAPEEKSEVPFVPEHAIGGGPSKKKKGKKGKGKKGGKKGGKKKGKGKKKKK